MAWELRDYLGLVVLEGLYWLRFSGKILHNLKLHIDRDI